MANGPEKYRVILVRDSDVRNPDHDPLIAADCKANGETYSVPEFIRMKKGSVYEHPDAWQAGRHGMGIPADEKCRQKMLSAGLSEDQLSRAILAAGQLAKGIGYDIPGMTPEEVAADLEVE